MIHTDQFVPRWMISKMIHRGGQRLPKKVSFAQPVIPFVQRDWKRYISGGTTMMSRQKLVMDDKNFAFDNWEYRFWCVETTDIGPQLATCRMCGSSFFAKEARRSHLNADGCAKRILTAYGLLLRDKLCIVCDTHTSHTEWGAPMCMGGTCKDIYMHEESQTGALEKALVLVLNTELIALA